MSEPITCDVCEGMGVYPIINRKGSELYSIQCPECFGSGSKEDADPVESPDLPPVSSAAKVRSVEDLREHVAKHWSPQNRSDGAL